MLKILRQMAFTLVELMVVIAVIAVLAAIAFPVFARIREKGRQTVCASNLRQLGMGSLLYAQDNEGYLPPFRNTSPGVNCFATSDAITGQAICDPASLHQCLDPYVRSQDVWFCPSDPFARKDVDVWTVNHRYSSFGFLFRWNLTIRDTGEYHRGGGTEPSKRVIIEDPHWWSDPKLAAGGDHFDGVNECYLDGHVKWRKRFDLDYFKK